MDLLTALEKRIKMNIPQQPFIAIVKTAPPEITLDYLGQTIPTPQIYVMNYLLSGYHRKYKLEGIIDKQHQDVSEYSFTNTTSTDTASGHTHKISSLAGSGTIGSTGNYEHHGDIWLTDTLRVGSEVLVQPVGNSYVVTGQVVRMGSQAKEGA